MITFKSLEYKNFLSTGNAANKILLNKSHSTLIVGKNGEGKSTMLDALCFALFGKPFRNINKPQLINSINGKNCVTTVEFTCSGKNYKVVRGIKPSVFEIWCDGKLINQEAASKDYQKVLEQQILRLNYKTFTQVVILGSASFVPFMQLSAAQRREVIEDILDIRIFSTMNSLLKEKVQTTKEEILRIEDSIILAKEKVNAQKKIIQTIQSAKTDTIDRLAFKIKQVTSEITEEQKRASSLEDEVKTLLAAVSDKNEVGADIKKATSVRSKFEHTIGECVKHSKFFSENDTCPSCSQGISEEYKQKKIVELEKEIESDQKKIAELDQALNKLNSRLEHIENINKQITDKNIALSTANNTISVLNRQLTELNSEIGEHRNNNSDVEIERSKLKELAAEAVSMIEKKATLAEQKNLQDIASLLLKDTGIKTAIIREYLPTMNKLINKYLNVMDSYIHFELDESFNEVIKSRFRDEFTYDSFSEGEKTRVDLAMLFTWRQIAKMKNSVNTNLLIFDEIMDSSLDTSGIEAFVSLLSQFGNDTNIFIISHKGDVLMDKFHSVIRFEKKNDFSVIAKNP